MDNKLKTVDAETLLSTPMSKTMFIVDGVPLKQIQEWLGHSDFSTTANIYAHLDYRSKISSAQAMEQGMLLPRSDDFGSRWENVTEQGEITGPDSNPVFD